MNWIVNCSLTLTDNLLYRSISGDEKDEKNEKTKTTKIAERLAKESDAL